MRTLLITIILASLFACQQNRPLDLPGLEGRAKAGDAAACRELVALLGWQENQVNDRAYAILVTLGPEVIPYLAAELDTDDRVQREYLLAALGTLQASDQVKSIAQLLADRRLERRYVAAWALGEIGQAQSVTPLIAALADADPAVRRYATRALIKFNREAVDPLLAALPVASGEAEAAMIRVLGDIADPRALPLLLERAQGDHRGEVFMALGKLKDPAAEHALVAGLQDTDWRVRMNAAMA
ncbi:MAG: hypothetical protein C0624_04665, partial [Desulfuromonas sp.]